MSIDDLIRAVPPPKSPGDAFHGRWHEVEARLGTRLPTDYKAFVERYGRGEFLEYVVIWTPEARDPDSRLEVAVPAAIENLGSEEDFPFPLWPSPGGLLPFGHTVYSDYLCWTTSGSPDDWGVAILDRGMLYEDAYRIDCGLAAFLTGLATGEILPSFFATDLLECEHHFSPYPSLPPLLIQVNWRLGPFGGGGEGRSTCRLSRH